MNSPSGEGGKFYETLNKYQSDFVKHKSHEARRKCAVQFRIYIESESRTQTIDEFTTFLVEINRTLVQLIGSADVPEKLCGIYLLDELIEVPYEENEIKITRFAQYLRMVYESSESLNLYLYQCATVVFGHLVRVGGVLVSDLIVGEARKSLDQLRSGKIEKTVPSLLILKTLAENAPTIFSPYLDSCIDSLWPALHSSNEHVRDCALDTLHQCILLVNTRLPSQRDQLYTRINTEILGLFKLNTADAIQGGLRAIALLLTYGGDFLLPHFNKVLELITQHKEHRDRAVRDTVVMLIPTLIAYSPASFHAGTQLPSLISHVIAILHKAQHESSISIAYISLGKIALHTGQALLYKLDVIANLVKDGLKKKTRTTHSSVLQCLSMLSRALGLALLPYATDLVDLLFEGGLSPALVQTLSELASNLPVLLPSIQSRLLSAISLILSQVDINNTAITKSTASFLSRAGILTSSSSSNINTEDEFDPNSPTGLISLALDTLGQFNFIGHNLLPFVYQRVLPWLNAADSKLRSQTARCCLNIVLRPPSNPMKLQLSHYLHMQDIIFAIQDQVQLQQKLLIIIAGDGTLEQYRATGIGLSQTQEDDDFDPDAIDVPKHWVNRVDGTDSSAQVNSSGRRTRTGSISVANTRLLTQDLKSSTISIKPIHLINNAPLPVPFSLRGQTATSPKTDRSAVGTILSITETPAALKNVAARLKAGQPASNVSTAQKKYHSLLTGNGSANSSSMAQPSNFQKQNNGVELFKNLLKVQLQVLTQLHVQLELFLSLQKQNFNNLNTFGSSLYSGAGDVGSQGGSGNMIGKWTPNTTTLAQTLTQDAHQLLAQIQVAQLQVQQEQQLVLQAQATGIDMSGLANSAIFDHLKRHKRRIKQNRTSSALTLPTQSPNPHSRFDDSGSDSPIHRGSMHRNSISVSRQSRLSQLGRPTGQLTAIQTAEIKHEVDSQILINAYISSGMAQELGIADLATYNSGSHDSSVLYINNIALCVLNDQQMLASSAAPQASQQKVGSNSSVPNQNLYMSGGSSPYQELDEITANAMNVQNLPKGWTVMVNEVLSRLTTITASDPDPTIRHNVLSLLTPQFDVYLSQPHHLSTLINVLKDSQLENKCVALTILSRLMPLNPVLVLPILRHHITEVVYQLQLSGSPKTREDSAAILTHIATHTHTFIKPYAIPILKVLVRVLMEASSPSVVSAVLVAIGETTLVAGLDAYQIIAQILPLLFCIISNKESHTIQTKNAPGSNTTGGTGVGNPSSNSAPSSSAASSNTRGDQKGATTTSSTAGASQTAARPGGAPLTPVMALLIGQTTVIGVSHYVALRCLRLIVSACGLSMVPYHIFPSLLTSLIRIVSNTLSTQARNEAVQLIGVVGAIDPFTAKLLHTRTTQITPRETIGVLMKGMSMLYLNTPIGQMFSFAAAAVRQKTRTGNNPGSDVVEHQSAASSASSGNAALDSSTHNFTKATMALLRGIKIDQDTIDDEVLRLLLNSKATEMQILLQQIRLKQTSAMGTDGDNDGMFSTALESQARYNRYNQLILGRQPSFLSFPPGSSQQTVLSQGSFDDLYNTLNKMSSSHNDTIYNAYVSYEEQMNMTAFNSDLNWSANNNNDMSDERGFNTGENPYNLTHIAKNKDKIREKDSTMAMVQMLTSSIAQSNPGGGTTGAGLTGVGANSSNNLLQLIKLAQPYSEISLELDIAGVDFYRLTAVKALVDILMDQAQSQSHRKSTIALMFMFKTHGHDCYKLLPHIVPAFVQALSYHNDDLRALILEQLGAMALLTSRHFRAYISPIMALLLLLWPMVNTIPQHVFWLIQRMSLVDSNEIQIYIPELLPKLLHILLTDKTPDRILSQHVLRACQSLAMCLEPYLHMILPALSNVWAIGSDSPLFVRCLSLHTTSQLIRTVPSLQHLPRLVLPLLELIQSSDHVGTTSATGQSASTPGTLTVLMGKPTESNKPNLMDEVLQTLCVVVHQMGPKYSKHILATQNLLTSKLINYPILNNLFIRILSQMPLSKTDMPPSLVVWKNDNIDTIKDLYTQSTNPFTLYDDVWITELGLNRTQFISSNAPNMPPNSMSYEKLPVNQPNLVKVWDTSQRLTSDDWTEWMKGVCVAMLKESPFPPLRACSVLAQKDHQLAQTLFTVGFASCWNELNDMYQDAIINALDHALKSPTTPSDVLSALLSLCEFMEHDDRPLPLDIRQLAHLSATKCHSFAKALHYKEQEFYTSSQPSLLLEDLISTHNKLQQPQAAIGILKMATSLSEFRGSLQENWYEQLHRWDEALAAYERKQISEGLLSPDGTTDLSSEVLASLQQTHTRNRFANGSILGSIVGGTNNSYSLTNSAQNGGEANYTAGRGSSGFNGVSNGSMLTSNSSNNIKLGGVNIDTILGRIRCLKALGDYDRVAHITIDLWNQLQHVALSLHRQVQELQQRSLFNFGANSADPSAGSSPRDSSKPFGVSFKAPIPPTPSNAVTNVTTPLPMIIPPHLSYELSLLPDLMSEVASLACEALHMLGKWDDLPPFFNALSPQILDRSFYSAIYNIHVGNLSQAESYLREAKKLVQDDIYALLGEGYTRAYSSIVGMQLLTELEEVVMYKRLGGHLSSTSLSATGQSQSRNIVNTFITHAQSHTHALSLSKMKPLHDTNNVKSYLHDTNPFAQSTLNFQLSQQLQSQYALGFDFVNTAVMGGSHGIHTLPQHHLLLSADHNSMLLNNLHYTYAQRFGNGPASGDKHNQHSNFLMRNNDGTTSAGNMMLMLDREMNSSLLSSSATRGDSIFSSSNQRSIMMNDPTGINYFITNNNDFTTKPSITTPAHLTFSTTSWNELLSRTQHRATIRTVWSQRIKSVQRNPYVWRHLLATRSLVLTPQQNTKFWISYAHMTSNMGRYDHSLDIIRQLLHRNPHQAPLDYDLHLSYLQYDPYLSFPTTKPSSTSSTQPSPFILDSSSSLGSLSFQANAPTHCPSKLMYLPSAQTMLHAISFAKPDDPFTQMLCDIFSLSTNNSGITYPTNATKSLPSSSYIFSFGVSTSCDYNDADDGDKQQTQTIAIKTNQSQEIRRHYYQQQLFGFNMDSTTHPLLALGSIAISPVTLAAAHHNHLAEVNNLNNPSNKNKPGLGLKTPSLAPLTSPQLGPTIANGASQNDQEEINNAKFHSSYIAYPCVLDDFLVSLAYCQHIWKVGYRTLALDRLTYLTQTLEYLLGLTAHHHSNVHHNIPNYLTHVYGKEKSQQILSSTSPNNYFVEHPHGDVIYVKHHRFCPHHPQYHSLNQKEIDLHTKEEAAKVQSMLSCDDSNVAAHIGNSYIPLVCMLSVCPPPSRPHKNAPYQHECSTTGTAQKCSHPEHIQFDVDDNQWYPLSPIRQTQHQSLTSLCSKLNRITGDWGLSILSSISPTFGILFDAGTGIDSFSSRITPTLGNNNRDDNNNALSLDLTNLPRVTRNVAETFALSTTLEVYQRSTLHSPYRYKGWHGWAVIHYRAAQVIRLTKQNVSSVLKRAQAQFNTLALGISPSALNSSLISSAARSLSTTSSIGALQAAQSSVAPKATETQLKAYQDQILQLLYDYDSLNKHLHLHVVAAITGFLHSISLARDTSQSLQELLRLLALWFAHGNMAGRKLSVPTPPTSAQPLQVKSIRHQYQDVIGLPPSVLGQNKLPAVADVLRQGFSTLPITTWVVVSPQIIARLHSSSAKGTIRVLIQELLLMIGQYHPQALVYPLTVAVKSEQQTATNTVQQHIVSVVLHRGLTIYGPRRAIFGANKSLQNNQLQSHTSHPSNSASSGIGMTHNPDNTPTHDSSDESQPQHKPTHNTALQVMSALRAVSPLLIEQAMVVSRELIRAAVLWHEIWHEALEEASRLWFTQQDPLTMLSLLLPLHQKMGLGSHSAVQIATAPSSYYIPTGNNISSLITTLPSFQINNKTAITAGAYNSGANIHQNLFAGPETPREIAFIHVFGRELSIAHDWCIKYLSHLAEEQLGIDSTQMWYNGELMGKVKKDLEGYQPGVQFYHPSRQGIQAMNNFLFEQHQLQNEVLFGTSSCSVTPALSTDIAPKITKSIPHASDLNQAWSVYCTVFRQLNKMINQGGDASQFFELHDVSPILLSCRDLVLAIPGTYDPKHYSTTICISRVISHFKVIDSKQRPRKLSIIGSDGEEHPFLLKGHEDLRQDTRVMQLFDLVNALLTSSSSSSSSANTANNSDSSSGAAGSNSSSGNSMQGSGGNSASAISSVVATTGSSQSNEFDLQLRGYSVTPLSPVSGLIQWLSNCDTLHALIKNYREARYVLVNAENKLMGQISGNWQNLCLLQKVEVFEHAMANTTGKDLADVLWLKAATSEQWLERRGNYTRSLAVTSMVGYILGLGDRHPCNLMLERSSAKVIHIDFGDCFEVAQHREKFPERVPFRLTRILVRALEVSGIEGTFRLTCEHVMTTLRSSKESVMAVLEAFIYDPLITWRLLNEGANVPSSQVQEEIISTADGTSSTTAVSKSAQQSISASSQTLIDDVNRAIDNTLSDDLDDHNIFNTKALSVIDRIESKLNGSDFHGRWSLSIQQRSSRVVQDKIKCLLGFGLDTIVSHDGTNKHADIHILSAQDQVELLIRSATNSQHLSQSYVGWCGFW